MTTKKVSKTSKPATKPAVQFDALKSAAVIADQLVQAHAAQVVLGDATKAINEQCKAMRAAKVKIGGSRRTCPISAALYDRMPESLAAGTKANYLTAIRTAVNEGKDFKFPNGSDKKAGKKTGAKTGGTGTIMIALSAGDKPEAAANKLRKGFEKMREASDDLAKLAAYLVDALDEAGFGGESESETE